MAATTKKQFKVNTLSKDLDLKLKDISDIMKGTDYDTSAQAYLDGEAFDVFFDKITSQNQISGIDDYILGAPLPNTGKKKADPEKESADVKAEVTNPADEKKPEVKKPEVKKPEVKKPEVKKPEPAKTPEQTKKPEPVKTPEQTKKPEQVKTPEQTKKPEQVKAPEQTKKPEPAPVRQEPKNTAEKKNDLSRFDRSQLQNKADPKKAKQDKNVRTNAENTKRNDNTVKVGSNVSVGTQKTESESRVRVVDTRTIAVDLSKYDDKLNNFVSDSVSEGMGRGDSKKAKKPVTKKIDPRNPEGRREMHDEDMSWGNKGFANNKNKHGKKNAPKAEVPKQKLHITVPDEITVGELASRLKVNSGEVIKKLMLMGIMANINQTVDFDTAYLVGDELGAEVEKEVVVTIEERLFEQEEDSEESLVERAPVVVVMGHVDHGKTSLLDAIRNAHVTRGEAGGITQHIGAYRVKAKGKDITFLDTPGHEAFTAMRARGAMFTDIAILVVAADDGIMPQTVESINHAKQAGVDIVVAINKMDKPTANPDMVKQELTKYELVPEEWGGDVICVPVSALTHMGIDDLLENLLLVAEVKELKANPNRRAKGVVIEAKLDKGRGPVATVLVQNGTLRAGDTIIAGTSVGHVRAMTDHNGKVLKKAGPSVPVEITGLAEVPMAGDEFNAVEDEKMARLLADQRRAKAKEEIFKMNARANLNDLFSQISAGAKDLNIIVKADVGGSVEAVKQSLEKLSNDEVKVKVIHAAAGGINESDVTFAAASNAIIVGFNVRPDKQAMDSAERQKVEIRTYRVIYECIEEVEAAMKGMLAPKYREVILGRASVRQTIRVPNVGTIAGSYVTDGKVTRSAQIRVVRDGIVIFEDKISSLRRFKDDVREVAQGYECGIGLEKFADIKENDVLEAFTMEEIER
ncbi:MAG: translation initiation factor IF-2 [Ruminococcaceae bacterium]|nr:translation initiation factor IF-2 [Oscillospiraceae bacterium]